MGERAREFVERVFGEAAELSGEERERYLMRACDGETTVLVEVRELLAADARETIGALKVEPLKAMLDAAAISSGTEEEERPATIGVYEVEGVIGEGGFGTVYRARQREPVDRVVAIKMVRAGMATRGTLRRFERERRTLAQLEHPNIARLLDAGTSERGRPYFVMELVRGVPLTEYCDARQLGVRARLGLFLRACEAIQHAHQRGVIHRDIKPSNVLVAEADGPGGRVDLKVIDFGIASILEDGLIGREARGATQEASSGEKTVGATGAGQFIGTPEYMSPEQAVGGKEVVDTRSDVYSLGVLLYQMLSGEVPRTRGEAIAATLRGAEGIADLAEIRRPSARVGGERAREVRGDLDWIVMRALEKRPEDRYASVSEMAEDVRRSMADEPILAHAPSRREVVRKFVRRHKFGVAAGAAVACALIAGVIGTSVGLVRARASARLAEERREEAELEAYIGRIAAAAGALEAMGPANLRTWLDEAPERWRGWEWRYLRGLADQSTSVPLRTNGVVQMLTAGTREGSERGWIAAACLDEGRVAVMDDRTGKEVGSIAQPNAECVRFSRDGSRLFCGSRIGADCARVYGTRSWQRLGNDWHIGPVWDADWSPDGQWVAALGGGDLGQGTVKIVDVVTGEVMIDTRMPGYFSVSWSADGRYIATGCADGTLRVWDCEGLRETVTKRVSVNKVDGVAFSPDGKLLAVTEDGGKVMVFGVGGEGKERLRSGAGPGQEGRFEISDLRVEKERASEPWGLVCELDQSRGMGFRVAFSPDSRKLAVASWNETVWVWDLATRLAEREWRGHDKLVHAVAWGSDGERLFSGGYDGAVRMWSMGDAPQRVRVSERAVNDEPCVSEDGAWCAMRVDYDRIALMGVSDGRERARVDMSGRGLTSYKFVPGGHELVVGNWRGELEIVDAFAGTSRVAAKMPEGRSMLVRGVSPSGRLVTGFLDGHGCVVVDLKNGETVWGWPRMVAWSGARFVGEDEILAHEIAGPIERWNIRTGERVMRSAAEAGNVYECALSGDGKLLATAAYAGEVSVIDAHTGGMVAGPAKLSSFPGLVAFTPDGERVISSGEDGVVRFWLPRTMRQVGAIRADTAWTIPALTRDGKTLVVKSASNVVRVWDGGK